MPVKAPLVRRKKQVFRYLETKYPKRPLSPTSYVDEFPARSRRRFRIRRLNARTVVSVHRRRHFRSERIRASVPGPSTRERIDRSERPTGPAAAWLPKYQNDASFLHRSMESTVADPQVRGVGGEPVLGQDQGRNGGGVPESLDLAAADTSQSLLCFAILKQDGWGTVPNIADIVCHALFAALPSRRD